jgi:glycerol uptake facilitator-like aquaporin
MRLLIIAGTLTMVVLIGERFGTIALNPARLLAPATVSQTMGGVQTMSTI